MGHAVYEDRFVVNTVKCVAGFSADVGRDRAWREFGNDDSHWSWNDGVGAVGLLQIKGATSVVVILAARVDWSGAVRWFRNGCTDWRIDFVVAVAGGLIIDAVAIIEGHSANRQSEESEGQHSEVAVETKIVPVVVAMDINVRVMMDRAIVTRTKFTAGFAAMLRFRANLNRALDGVSIKMAD